MNRRLICSTIAAWGACWLAIHPATGQLVERAHIDRPSSSSPSQRLGWTGGDYTLQVSNAVNLTGAPIGFVSGLSSRGLTTPNFFGASSLGRLPPPALPQAFAFAPVGYVVPPYASKSSASWLGAANELDLARVTLLQASERLTVPLTGLGYTGPPLVPRPYFAPQPAASAVHGFFGLVPAQPAFDSAGTAPVPDVVTLLERKNQERAERQREQALAAFRQALTASAEQRPDALAGAHRDLANWRNLDPTAHLPCQLLVHVALAEQSYLLAMEYLGQAVQRYPALFATPPGLAAYFGDAESVAGVLRSRLLETQMREHLQIGDRNPGVAGAYALQAYCAWVLGDAVRLRDALDKLKAAEEQAQAADPKLVAMRQALSAALP